MARRTRIVQGVLTLAIVGATASLLGVGRSDAPVASAAVLQDAAGHGAEHGGTPTPGAPNQEPSDAAAPGHHTPSAGDDDAAVAPDGLTAPAHHDHGDLQVTIEITQDEVTVSRPITAGAWITVVNRSGVPQTLASTQGLRIEVPLQRLVTIPGPTVPGVYALVSTTDPELTADLTVR